MFFEKQQEWIVSLQNLGNDSADVFFRFLNYFDSEYFVFLLIPLIWIGYSSKWGIRVTYLVLINAFVNSLAKNLLSQPRPDASIWMVSAGNYGLPSGGAQTAMLLGCLLIYYWKNKWAWPIGLFYIILISLSRVYLGVHFPTDVLGGWVIGFALFGAFILLSEKIEVFARKKPYIAFPLSELIPIIIMFLSPQSKTFFPMSAVMAVSLGILISLSFGLYMKPTKKIGRGLLRALIAIIGIFIILIILNASGISSAQPLFHIFVKSFIISLWISLGASPFCKLIRAN